MALELASQTALLWRDVRAGFAPWSHALIVLRIAMLASSSCRLLFRFLLLGHCQSLVWAVLEWTRLARRTRIVMARSVGLAVVGGLLLRFRSVSLVSAAMLAELAEHARFA